VWNGWRIPLRRAQNRLVGVINSSLRCRTVISSGCFVRCRCLHLHKNGTIERARFCTLFLYDVGAFSAFSLCIYEIPISIIKSLLTPKQCLSCDVTPEHTEPPLQVPLSPPQYRLKRGLTAPPSVRPRCSIIYISIGHSPLSNHHDLCRIPIRSKTPRSCAKQSIRFEIAYSASTRWRTTNSSRLCNSAPRKITKHYTTLSSTSAL
jgi:hypothetical protein